MIIETGMTYVVDDDESVRSAVSRLLRSSGFSVETFASAAEFIQIQFGKRPSCLVLDVHMPDVTGLELQNLLNERFESIPIIFLTGHGDIPMSVKAMKAGAFDFLPKPVDSQQLVDTVRKAIEHHANVLTRNAELTEFIKRLDTLTARERQVLELVVEGWLNKNIGSQLEIAEATVKVHRGRVMDKLGVTSVAELARLCERAEL